MRVVVFFLCWGAENRGDNGHGDVDGRYVSVLRYYVGRVVEGVGSCRTVGAASVGGGTSQCRVSQC